MKKNKKIFQYTSLIVGTILFIFALKYTGMDNILTSLKIVNKKAFFFYLLISISIFFGFVFRWYLIIKCHNYNISLFKLFNYRVAGFAISYLTPSARVGGEPIRTYFLVKNKIPFEKAMSSVVIDKSLELTANAVMTVIGAIIFAFFVVLSNKIKWLIMIIVLIKII
jgi:glycosyltransferase 2 family protein